MNTAAKNLAIGNYAAFEEFTAFDDSDYDSSDCEEEPPSDGPPIDGPPLAPIVKPPPKSDKNHEVKPKASFLKPSLVGRIFEFMKMTKYENLDQPPVRRWTLPSKGPSLRKKFHKGSLI